MPIFKNKNKNTEAELHLSVLVLIRVPAIIFMARVQEFQLTVTTMFATVALVIA